MIVTQAYRFALDPTAAQRRALHSHCGAARFAFNWGLAEVRAAMALAAFERAMGMPLSRPLNWNLPALRREWNQAKNQAAPWWPENSKEAYNSGLDALARALRNWSDSHAGRRAGPAVRFPRFHSRSHRESCRFTTGVIRVDDQRHITLPRIGRLRTSEGTAVLGRGVSTGLARVLSATISREAERLFVSFTCAVERELPATNGRGDTVGVDLGVLALATISDGTVVAGPRALRRGLRRLRRLSRHHSRCQRGSANRRRAARRLARHHRRVAAVRRDHLHKLTTMLAKSHGRIVIEDLNVAGMTRSARGTAEAPGCNVRAKSGLNRSLADAGFGEVRRLLGYKCRWYGSELIVADRFFASSRTCSACGTSRGDLRLSDRTFRCEQCGLTLDRDLNAAVNLAGWVHPAVADSAPETQNACPRGGQTAHCAARLDDAGTGHVPEPTDLIGGRHIRGLPLVLV